MSYFWRKPHQLDGSALRDAVGPLPQTEPSVAVYEALLALGFGPPDKVHSVQCPFTSVQTGVRHETLH